MKYAMVLKGRVIDVLENQNEAPNYPPDKKGNVVTAVECDSTVKIGMIYHEETNTFSDYVPPVHIPTASEQVLAIVSKSKEEIENAAIDAFTEELIEGGML